MSVSIAAEQHPNSTNKYEMTSNWIELSKNKNVAINLKYNKTFIEMVWQTISFIKSSAIEFDVTSAKNVGKNL